MSPDEGKEAGDQGEADEGYGAGGAPGRILYRAMREDPAGRPLVGPTARTLGVRPTVDVPVVAGKVSPNTGGISVAVDRPENLHPLRRPPAYGGSGKDPVWCIGIDLLGHDLQFRQDSATHGLIEPARTLAIDELRKALEATKPSWKKLP
jgi:hypothetical protein